MPKDNKKFYQEIESIREDLDNPTYCENDSLDIPDFMQQRAKKSFYNESIKVEATPPTSRKEVSNAKRKKAFGVICSIVAGIALVGCLLETNNVFDKWKFNGEIGDLYDTNEQVRELIYSQNRCYNIDALYYVYDGPLVTLCDDPNCEQCNHNREVQKEVIEIAKEMNIEIPNEYLYTKPSLRGY